MHSFWFDLAPFHNVSILQTLKLLVLRWYWNTNDLCSVNNLTINLMEFKRKYIQGGICFHRSISKLKVYIFCLRHKVLIIVCGISTTEKDVMSLRYYLVLIHQIIFNLPVMPSNMYVSLLSSFIDGSSAMVRFKKAR